MLGVDDPATFLKIRDTLLAQCAQVAELDRRELVRVWRDWHAAFPMEPKRHRAQSSLVSGLCALRRSLTGKHALAAYRQQAADDVFVLCVDALVGWRCKGIRTPGLDEIEDADLIVTSSDFAWTFGLHNKWRRRGPYGGPVFVEPGMLPETLP